MLTVNWIKSTADNWLEFQTFNIGTCLTKCGVYKIWHAGNPGRYVYVGQGDVAARLKAHRNDKRITACATYGTLYVTWAAVQAGQLDGVERYLADRLNPLIGDAHPDCVGIPVNLAA